jgi:DNA-binding beta-propeller fold protein YncE
MADRRRTVRVGAATGAAVLAGGLGLGLAPGAASALSTAGPDSASAATIALPAQFVPSGVAVDSDTDTAYVSEFVPGTNVGEVAVVDLADDKVVATIPDTAGQGSSIAVDDATDTVYATGTDGNLAVIDGATNAVTATIPLGPPALPLRTARNGIQVDTATDTVYVAAEEAAGWEVAAVDGATNTLINSLPVPSGFVSGLAVDSATNTVYATSSAFGNEHILVIDGGSDTISDTITPAYSDASAVVVNQDTDVFYVLGATGGQTLSAYSGATNDILGTATLAGELPVSIAANPVTDTEYVDAQDESGLTSRIKQINGAGTTTFGTIPVADWGYLAVDTVTDSLVAAEANSTLQVFPLAAPAIGGPASATFTVGHAGSVNLGVTGLPSPAVTEAGKLPAGVSLSAPDSLTGTPKAGAGGVYPLTISAANGIGVTATRRFTLTVDQAPAITSVNKATFTHGKSGLLTVRTAGFPIAAVTEQGTLPAGVRFTAEKNGEATLSGVPATSTKGKTYVIRFTARNGVGSGVVQSFTLRIS